MRALTRLLTDLKSGSSVITLKCTKRTSNEFNQNNRIFIFLLGYWSWINDGLQLPNINFKQACIDLYLQLLSWINNLIVFTCLSWEVYWFICLNECPRLINHNHDFSDFFRGKCSSLNFDMEVQYRVSLDWGSLCEKHDNQVRSFAKSQVLSWNRDESFNANRELLTKEF